MHFLKIAVNAIYIFSFQAEHLLDIFDAQSREEANGQNDWRGKDIRDEFVRSRGTFAEKYSCIPNADSAGPARRGATDHNVRPHALLAAAYRTRRLNRFGAGKRFLKTHYIPDFSI